MENDRCVESLCTGFDGCGRCSLGRKVKLLLPYMLQLVSRLPNIEQNLPINLGDEEE